MREANENTRHRLCGNSIPIIASEGDVPTSRFASSVFFLAYSARSSYTSMAFCCSVYDFTCIQISPAWTGEAKASVSACHLTAKWKDRKGKERIKKEL